MQKHPDITKVRIRQTLEQRLKPLVYPEQQPAQKLEAWAVRGEPVPYTEAENQTYEPFEVGQKWGASWDTVWFRIQARIPEAWEGKHVLLQVRLGGIGVEGFTVEGLVWNDGAPYTAVNQNRKDILLSTKATGGETQTFYIEAAANGYAAKQKGDLSESPDYHLPPAYTLEQASLATYDPEAWQLVCDWQCLFEQLDTLPENDPKHGQLLRALNEAVNHLDRGTSINEIREHLALYLRLHNGDTAHQISAIGHAHIDTAWLWPLRETIRKCARTFRTTLNYMEDYPEFVFGCSQPVQYSWIKKYYPTIYEDIKKAHQHGQWELLGAMWIEPDCNVPTGESLVRQILHGKLFFREEFGEEPDNVWIPDVFGYAASMPQIMIKSGLRYFLTQKISWNQFNRFPHHSFHWQGIDGSQVFTHFMPSDTYNANFSPKQILESQNKFRDHDRATRSLYAYGYGDGGGGPTPHMLENAKRLQNLEGMPKVKLEKAETFFEKADAELTDPPLWVGELYLEYHRGTYTTQADTKKGNREGEIALYESEIADAMAWLLTDDKEQSDRNVQQHAPERAVYDTFEYAGRAHRHGRAPLLDRAWKLLLLNQFHDILPGSSRNWIYQDAARDYATIKELTRLAHEDASQALHRAITTTDITEPLLVNNPSPVAWAGVVNNPDGNTPAWIEAPALGYAVQSAKNMDEHPQSIAPVEARIQNKCPVLENEHLIVEFNQNGHIERLYGKDRQREVLASEQVANLLQIHPDNPMTYEAWDIDIYYRDTVENLDALESIEITENGPLRGTIRVTRRFGDSTIQQDIQLCAGSRRIDFVTHVNWQERKKLLKAAFPVAIHNDKATYEIQYGSLERPTHSNTSWDMARFEAPAQRWADLSEGDYGVALLNNCKYGYDIQGSVMRLTLLRGPENPDPYADLGNHQFTYSLYPHAGNHREGGVIEEATRLNQPPHLQRLPEKQTGNLPTCMSWIEVLRRGFYITAFKMTERKEALVIRGYEGWGTRGPLCIKLGIPVQKVWLADLMEEPQTELTVNDGQIKLEIQPFEIITLLVEK